MNAPGAARERTAVAWGRTGLGVAGLALLLLRLGFARHSWVEVAAAAVAAGTSVGFFRQGRRGYRGSRSATGSVSTMRTAALALSVIGVLAIIGALT